MINSVNKLIEQLNKRADFWAKYWSGRGLDDPDSGPLREAATALARLAGERDEVRALIEDLLSWFPEKPAPSEWRIRAGELGADGAISAARKFIGGNDA